MIVDLYSDIDLQDPPGYYGGYKPARAERHDVAQRLASDPWSGDWRGSSYRVRLSDIDRSITRRKASADGRFWTEPLTARMINRDARANLITPWTIWVGPIIDAQPDGLSWELTLGDIVAQKLLSDDAQLPYRMIRDGFLDTLAEINPDLDLDQPEPIIYGRHWRIPDVDPASPQGFVITPILLGKLGLPGGGQWYVWMIAGHACHEVPSIIVDGVETFEVNTETAEVDWYIPGHSNYNAEFPAVYQDRVSSTYGTTRRYTLLFGRESHVVPDSVANGTMSLAVTVSGIEENGDGSGALILDRFQAYKHFLINYVANSGQDSYHTGAWLTNPTWSIYGSEVPIVHEESFDEGTAIGIERLPDNDGYIVAAIIGARAGDQSSVRRWIADWNRSCGCRFAVTHRGRMRIGLMHPTAAVKAAARFVDDVNVILKDSFGTTFGWTDQANQILFRTDYEHLSGQWKTNDVAIIEQAVADYGPIPSPRRDYPFAPGHTAAYHLAVLEGRQRKDPPQVVALEATIGPHPVTLDSLGYVEIFDYIKYRHYEAVGTEGEIRLGQVIGHEVLSGERKVRVALVDCEELIDFDVFEGEPPT